MLGSAKVAVIFRSFSRTTEGVNEVVERALLSAQAAVKLNHHGQQVVDQVLFVVPRDYDCRLTASALIDALDKAGLNGVHVLLPPGHHSCGALNAALAWCENRGIDYVVILSNKAIQYLTPANIEKIQEGLFGGLRVVGVEIKGLSDIAESPIQNTFAVWNLKALMQVGGFECETGVEEVAPIVKMMKKHGACSGLVPTGTESLLSVRQSADGQTRHQEVKNTKRAAQEAEAVRLGVSLEWVKENILVIQ